MHPPLRDQGNFHLDPVNPGVSFDPSEDKTRQEFKQDADVNVIVRRFGANVFAGGSYGEQDFTLDLQEVQLATRRALEAYARLPEAVQVKYATQEALLAGLARGDLVLDGDRLQVVEPEAAKSAASGSATSQAEGAAAAGESVT